MLQKWLDSDPLDAAIAVQAGLNELIDELNNSHEKAVFTGGMRAAGSTRWGGTAERHDDQGNMCCPDCETRHSAMFSGTVPFTTGIARLQNLFAPSLVVLAGVKALLQLCL